MSDILKKVPSTAIDVLYAFQKIMKGNFPTMHKMFLK